MAIARATYLVEGPWPATAPTRSLGMDEAAFDALYAVAFRRLVAQVFAICGDLTEAQDCVQEAFIRAWDKRHTLDRDASPEGWVRTTACRLAVSRWRRARLALRLSDRSRRSPSVPEPGVLGVALQRAMAQLTADQRRAIALYHLADLSVAEVAAEMDAPVGTVKAWLARGRARLAVLLEDPVERSEP